MDELQSSFESILQNLHIILYQRESQVCPRSVECLQEVKYFRNQTHVRRNQTHVRTTNILRRDLCSLTWIVCAGLKIPMSADQGWIHGVGVGVGVTSEC